MPASGSPTNSSCTDSWTITVPSEVQRWPAVPKPLNSEPSAARSRSASGITTSGFLPPSSRQGDCTWRPHSSPIREPTSDEPVKPTLSTRRSASARSRPSNADGPSHCTRFKTPSGSPPARNSSVSAWPRAGAYSAGFQTTALPHRSAGTRYQDGTATGKLPAVMIAATPTGLRNVKSCLSGSSLGTVWPYRRRPSETKKSQVSITSWTSPSDSGYGLPISRVSSRERLSLLSSTRRPIRPIAFPRTGGGVAAQARCPSRACPPMIEATLLVSVTLMRPSLAALDIGVGVEEVPVVGLDERLLDLGLAGHVHVQAAVLDPAREPERPQTLRHQTGRAEVDQADRHRALPARVANQLREQHIEHVGRRLEDDVDDVPDLVAHAVDGVSGDLLVRSDQGEDPVDAPLPRRLVLPVEQLRVALARDRALLPKRLPDAGEAVVERGRPLDVKRTPAAVEPLARQQRQQRVDNHPSRARREAAAAVLLDEDAASQDLHETREPAQVGVPDAPGDRLGVLVRVAEGAGEPVLGERVDSGALERDRRPKPAVAVVDREVAGDRPRDELAEDPQLRRGDRRHPDELVRPVVASEEEQARSERVVLVVLGVAGLPPLHGERQIAICQPQPHLFVLARIPGDEGVPRP